MNPPLSQSDSFDAVRPAEPEVSTSDKLVPRHIAASFDVTMSFVAGILAAKLLPEEWKVAQVVLFVVTILAYYFVAETLFARTLGKWCMGLVVTDYDGHRCTPRQAIVRNVMRLLEANPFLLGALPDALSVAFTKHRQRFGDRVAKTIVVPTRRVS